ncbi:retropepsin-like aspartic protease [Mucilaginibacter sp. BT774]|uniref:retropepsin-like aspartic protease n=1 Tax=Mucilaginibacter sp. BT774 TaxID=3062276 RepID=UPI00267693F5|nr:retropepsin-like aspartic protease [Mucilaginibacter sp. BT774]
MIELGNTYYCKMTITVPLQIIDLHGDGYHPLVEIKINGIDYILVLDTGASKTAFDHDQLAQSGVLITASERLSTGLGVTNMISSTAVIHDIQIGDLYVPDFEVAVLDLSTINIAYRQLNHPEVLGVLGGDILMKYRAVIDYGQQTLSFHIES